MDNLTTLADLCAKKNLHFCLRTDETRGYYIHVHKTHEGRESLLMQYSHDLENLIRAANKCVMDQETDLKIAAKALIKQLDLSNWVETENHHNAKNLKALADLRQAVEKSN